MDRSLGTSFLISTIEYSGRSHSHTVASLVTLYRVCTLYRWIPGECITLAKVAVPGSSGESLSIQHFQSGTRGPDVATHRWDYCVSRGLHVRCLYLTAVLLYSVYWTLYITPHSGLVRCTAFQSNLDILLIDDR